MAKSDELFEQIKELFIQFESEHNGGSKASKARARKAKDEIVLLNMKHCNTNGIAIAENEEKQVQQAFDLKIVKTAKEREAELKLPE